MKRRVFGCGRKARAFLKGTVIFLLLVAILGAKEDKARVRELPACPALAAATHRVVDCPVFPISNPGQLLGPRDVLALRSSPADQRIAYGGDPHQFGELRLPKSPGPHPVAIVIHGGCWVSAIATLQLMDPFCYALTSAGMATWNIEYRGVDTGGGWTGTFDDVATAIDHLRTMAVKYHLDLKRVVAVGHSAGGHLALWAAARHRLQKSSPLYKPDPLPLSGIVDLAGPGDLEKFLSTRERGCGDSSITRLVAGVSERYRDTSPARLLPLGVPQIMITGAEDDTVPARLSQEYGDAARKSGDNAKMTVVERAGHFEVIAPGSIAWSTVEKAMFDLLRMTK